MPPVKTQSKGLSKAAALLGEPSLAPKVIAKKSTAQEEFATKLSSETLLEKLTLIVMMTLLYPPLEMLWCILTFALIFYRPPAYPLLVRSLLLLYGANVVFDLDGYPSLRSRSPYFRLRSYFRNLTIWSFSKRYFCTTVLKTAELPPDHHYLLNYHPHGLIGLGLASAMQTAGGGGLSELFPSLDYVVATLLMTFRIPFFREWILAHGFVNCDKPTLLRVLRGKDSKTGTPRSVFLVPGGANEALYAHPGHFKLHLKDRKGFVKIALQTGASLVPVLGFGENELFLTVDNESDDWFSKRLYKMQIFFMKRMSFSVPIFMHILPKREKLTVVVGKPIHTDKRQSAEPSDALVDEVHQVYVEQLTQLYNEHKVMYGKNIPLEIV